MDGGGSDDQDANDRRDLGRAIDAANALSLRWIADGIDGRHTVLRRGHFPQLAEEPLAVGPAKQAAIAEFSELGFRAAAVTAVAGMAGGIPEDDPYSLAVVLDRPFGFLAVRRDLGLVLVAGWVADVEEWKPDALGLG